MATGQISVRARHKAGTLTFKDLPEACTVADLRKRIAKELVCDEKLLVLKVGMPPTLLPDSASHKRLTEAGCGDRGCVIVEERPEAPESNAAARGSKRKAAEATSAEPSLLAAFDRAIATAQQHVKMCPEDKHHLWALRRGKAAVADSIAKGNNISLGALHTLKGVGLWVAQQVEEHLQPGSAAGREDNVAKRRATAGARTAVAPPTPNSFKWWYVDSRGERVEDRNSAQVKGPLRGEEYRVCILHASGRMERAWLPEHKAPPNSPAQ